jgi:uncharacterized membrane protein
MWQWLFKFPARTWREGRIVFEGPLRPELVVLGLLAFGALAWWMYARVAGKVPARTRKTLLGLRWAALAVLFAMLAGPALEVPLPPGGSMFTAVVIDASESMSIPDAGPDGKTPRIDVARSLLAGPDGLSEALGAESRVVVYALSDDASRVPAPDDVSAEGTSTDFYRSMRTVEAELRGVPLASVVLVSDGARNAGGSAEDAARLFSQRGAVLHTVGLGDPTPPKDYEVLRVTSPRRVRRNTQVEVFATIRATDLPGPLDVQVHRDDALLVSKRFEAGEGAYLRRVRLELTPDLDGSATYTVSIPPADGEAVTANNRQSFDLEILDDRLPVLYVEGSPRMEYRFLRRALFRDPDFRLVGLLRLASDRFHVQGANADEQSLRKGFPTTPEQLFSYEAVILGDIEADYFTPQQREMLERFVSRRGGGLLMLGGVNSFGAGGWPGTPVARALPVNVAPADGRYADGRVRVRPTEEGLEHPVLHIAGDRDSDARLWELAPPVVGLSPVSGVKAGASVLLGAVDSPAPILAVQNYGSGRSAAFLSGGSWYWQVSRPASDLLHEKFWKQLVRWLAVGARRQLAVETDAGVYGRRDPVTMRATVLAEDLEPVNDAAVTATVTDPLGNREQLAMDWILSADGVYQARYVPTLTGRYDVALAVEGWDVSGVETGFQVSRPLVEFTDAGQKALTLKRMAELGGGRYFAEREAEELGQAVVSTVRDARRSVTTRTSGPLWDMPAALIAFVMLVCCEWLVRRRSSLA